MIKYTLVRKEDNAIRIGNVLKSIRILQPARKNVIHESKKPTVGENVYLEKNIAGITAAYWLTTEVTEILEEDSNKIVFKTENNTYILTKEDA